MATKKSVKTGPRKTRPEREEILKVNAQLEEKVKALEREVSQRRHVEESLKESEKRLQALSYQLLTAQEAERKRVARELHDSIG